MKILHTRRSYPEIYATCFCTSENYQDVITAAINTRDLAKNMVRVKSSNVWSYGMNVREAGDNTGEVVAQFKDKNGGPGDIYIYYDVPVLVYRKWISAPSKGHYFWVNIRNQFKYSKLTGDRIGKLPNAINHRVR